MAILDESPSALIPRVLRDLLAADSGVSSFFDRVLLLDRYQLDGPMSVPCLVVVPGTLEPTRTVGGEVEALYRIQILAVLPAPTPADATITALSAPTLGNVSGGSLTGNYTYRTTQVTRYGESVASAAASITVSGKNVTVAPGTLAASALAWRVWRGAAGKVACRHVATLRASQTTFTDGVPDAGLSDELAPVQLYAERILDHVGSVLYANESLTVAGVRIASDAILCTQTEDAIVPGRNLRIRTLIAQVPTYIDPEANRVITESV